MLLVFFIKGKRTAFVGALTRYAQSTRYMLGHKARWSKKTVRHHSVLSRIQTYTPGSGTSTTQVNCVSISGNRFHYQSSLTERSLLIFLTFFHLKIQLIQTETVERSDLHST